MDSDCPRQIQLVSTVFDISSSGPEMVFQSGCPWGGRIFSMDYDCLRVAQLALVIGHTRDRSGRSLLEDHLSKWTKKWTTDVYCRHREKHWESSSRTSINWQTSKNHVPHTGNRSESVPLQLWATTLKNRRKLHAGPTSPGFYFRYTLWKPPSWSITIF